MKKVIWSVEQVQQNKVVKIGNVVIATLSNHSDNEVIFEVDGVKRVLPPFDKVNKIPVNPFKIEIPGYEFDLDIKVFFGADLKNLIIDYAKIKDC